jgi:hypothetical protein
MCASTSVYGLHTNDGVSSEIELHLLLPKMHISHWYQLFLFSVSVGAPFLRAVISIMYVKFPEWSSSLRLSRYPPLTITKPGFNHAVGQLPNGART